MKEIAFEEFEIGASRSSGGRTITETDIVLHAGQSGDFYPHHMDAEWCKTQPFKQRIAHGTLIFTIGVGQTAGEINPLAMTYGYEKLRFPETCLHWGYDPHQGDHRRKARSQTA